MVAGVVTIADVPSPQVIFSLAQPVGIPEKVKSWLTLWVTLVTGETVTPGATTVICDSIAERTFPVSVDLPNIKNAGSS